VQSGDSLIFQADKDGVRVKAARAGSPFAKYRGIGNPDIGTGRKAIARWLRNLRDA
jgi:hypothetical protein